MYFYRRSFIIYFFSYICMCFFMSLYIHVLWHVVSFVCYFVCLLYLFMCGISLFLFYAWRSSVMFVCMYVGMYVFRSFGCFVFSFFFLHVGPSLCMGFVLTYFLVSLCMCVCVHVVISLCR